MLLGKVFHTFFPMFGALWMPSCPGISLDGRRLPDPWDLATQAQHRIEQMLGSRLRFFFKNLISQAQFDF